MYMLRCYSDLAKSESMTWLSQRAFETNDLNLTTANFDSYGNVSFDPCEFTLHTATNAENNDCSNKLVCFLSSVNVDLFQSCF
jgi:hypothetical protein